MACADHTLWAMYLTGVSPTEKLVLIFMADGGGEGDDRVCLYRIDDDDELARKACLTRAELVDVLAALVEHGLLQVWVPDVASPPAGSSVWYRVMSGVEPAPREPLTPQQKERNKQLGRAARQRVFERCGGRCVWCHATDELEMDHVVPVARGGKTVESNMQVLCGPCNGFKGTRANDVARAQRMRHLRQEMVAS